MRAVIDTNILVRVMLKPEGSLVPVLDLLCQDRYLYLYSRETLAEIVEVLERPRMVHKYRISSDRVEALRDLLVIHGEEVTPTSSVEVCRDPKDDKFLAVALHGEADVVVTGDDDLLVLDPFEGIRIIKPQSFMEMLSSAPPQEIGRTSTSG